MSRPRRELRDMATGSITLPTGHVFRVDRVRGSVWYRGKLPGMVRSGATSADACTEFLRYVKDDPQRKPSTIAGYESIIRSMLLPAFGEEPVESITTAQIERWLAGLPQSARTKTLALVLLHGIFRRAKKVWGLSSNPAAEVEKPPAARGNDLQVFSPQEVWALVRAADNPQDAPSSSPHRSPA